MKAVNIRRVYYIDNIGNIVYENVSDMISIHSSSVAYHIYTLKNKNVNETMFFNELLMSVFPSRVKKINFDIFLRHDMCSVLPSYSYSIKSISGKNVIVIMNDVKENILMSELY